MNFLRRELKCQLDPVRSKVFHDSENSMLMGRGEVRGMRGLIGWVEGTVTSQGVMTVRGTRFTCCPIYVSQPHPFTTKPSKPNPN